MTRFIFNISVFYFKGELIDANEKTYEKLMNFNGVVFIEFYVTWCSWCRKLVPIWKELPKRFLLKEHIRIARVDCTLEKELCRQNNINIYPTLIMFKKGRKAEEYLGNNDLKHLIRFVKLHAKYLHSDEL